VKLQTLKVAVEILVAVYIRVEETPDRAMVRDFITSLQRLAGVAEVD
jgi:hypothetical protein